MEAAPTQPPLFINRHLFRKQKNLLSGFISGSAGFARLVMSVAGYASCLRQATNAVRANKLSARELHLPDASLIVEDNTQERTVDVKPAIVLDEAQFLEFVHEKIDPRTRGSDHFRQDLL